MPQQAQVVYDSSGAQLYDATKNLANSIRENRTQDQNQQQLDQQAANALSAMLQHLGANRDQYEQVRAKVAQTRPEVAKMMVPADYAKSDSETATDNFNRTIADRSKDPNNITPATSDAGMFQNATGAAIPSQVTKANELRNALKPPTGYTPTPQEVQAAEVGGGLAESANNAADNTLKAKHYGTLESQGQQRTSASVAHQAASASAQNELATNRRQQRDPNSGFVAAKVVERGKPAVDPMQKHADDLIKLADKLDADAAKQRDATVAQQMRDEAARTRMRVNEIRKASAKQPVGPQHFQVDLKSGKVTPIAGPPSDSQDENDSGDDSGDDNE